MPKPTTAYIFANSAGRIRFGVTKDLAFELDRVRGEPHWETAGCVWWRELASLAEASRWAHEFRRMGPRRRRALIEERNPDWQDLSGRPARARVLAGMGTFTEFSDEWFMRTAALRTRLAELGIDPEEFDPDGNYWGKSDSSGGDFGLGGVGAVRKGWPDFPTPRVGSAANEWPVETA